MDYYQKAIVRIVPMRELVKDVISDAKAKNYVLALQTQKDVEVMRTLGQPDTATLHCVMVDQYCHIVGDPFLVFV